MRARVKRVLPETALMRVLDAFAQEAIEASDQEITEAAADLRMDLSNRESAAFAGLTYFARPQLSEFFEIEGSTRAPVERFASASARQPENRQRLSKQRQTSTWKKPPGK